MGAPNGNKNAAGPRVPYVDSRDLPSRPPGVKMFGDDPKSNAHRKSYYDAMGKALMRAKALREG